MRSAERSKSLRSSAKPPAFPLRLNVQGTHKLGNPHSFFKVHPMHPKTITSISQEEADGYFISNNIGVWLKFKFNGMLTRWNRRARAVRN